MNRFQPSGEQYTPLKSNIGLYRDFPGGHNHIRCGGAVCTGARGHPPGGHELTPCWFLPSSLKIPPSSLTENSPLLPQPLSATPPVWHQIRMFHNDLTLRSPTSQSTCEHTGTLFVDREGKWLGFSVHGNLLHRPGTFWTHECIVVLTLMRQKMIINTVATTVTDIAKMIFLL